MSKRSPKPQPQSQSPQSQPPPQSQSPQLSVRMLHATSVYEEDEEVSFQQTTSVFDLEEFLPDEDAELVSPTKRALVF